MTIEFRDKNNNYINQWRKWYSKLIPVKRDIVLLYFGVNKGVAVEHLATKCIIDGASPHKLACVID